MSQPPGFESSSQPNYVCHLHRSLYGLKQSPRLWFQKFNSFMLTHGYSRLLSEPNIYIRHKHSSNQFLIVALYVDDIPLVGTPSEITQAKLELSQAFSITDLGPLSYFLGMQIKRDRTLGTLIIHQNKFTNEILKSFGMLNIKPCTTPLPLISKVSLVDSPTTPKDIAFMKQFPFKHLIGKLRYLANGTCPDLGFAINYLRHFMHNPSLMHWKLVQRVMRYIKDTSNYRLTYKRFQYERPLKSLIGWFDSD